MVPNGPRHPKHWVKVSKPVSSRLPLWTIRKIRNVKFWWKLLESESYILKSVYQDLFKRTEIYPCVKYRRLLNVKKNVTFIAILALGKFGIVEMLQTKDCSWIILDKDYKTVFNKIVVHFFQHHRNVFCIDI